METFSVQQLFSSSYKLPFDIVVEVLKLNDVKFLNTQNENIPFKYISTYLFMQKVFFKFHNNIQRNITMAMILVKDMKLGTI